MSNTTILKLCKKCEKEKPLSEFRKQKNARDNLYPSCIICHDLDSQDRYEKNKLKRIKQAVDWNEKNKDKTKEYKKTYYQSIKHPPENIIN
jgi:hypothetical protein